MTDLTDGPFYVDLAQRIGGPVLEIGCGTGRVLLPIARAGTTIHGVDSSLPMLGILREKIVRRYYRKDAADKIHQIYTLTFLLRTYEDGDLIREECESLTLSYYTYPHLRALFLLTGLEVVEEYGSFSKAPLDNSATDMIFLLRRTV